MFINVLNKEHTLQNIQIKLLMFVFGNTNLSSVTYLFFFHVFIHNLLLEAWDLKMYMPNSYSPQG